MHTDLSLLPEALEINEDMLSEFMQEIWLPEDKTKASRLTLNLYDKQNYIVHYRQLKFAIRHGFEITDVHRIMSFNQTCWLSGYIEFNTCKQQEAVDQKNGFGVMLHKLANNVIFRKSVENLRNRCHRSSNTPSYIQNSLL